MTLADFYPFVLKRIAVLAAGEAASDEDRAEVRDVYALVHTQLLRRNLVSWGASADIPDEFVLPVASIVGAQVAPHFELQFSAGDAEAELRRLNAADAHNDPVPATYF